MSLAPGSRAQQELQKALKTGDGHVIVGAANQPSWEKFAHTIDAAPLLEDERFADNPGRVSNLDPLVRLPAAPCQTALSWFSVEADQS